MLIDRFNWFRITHYPFLIKMVISLPFFDFSIFTSVSWLKYELTQTSKIQIKTKLFVLKFVEQVWCLKNLKSG